MPTLSGIVLDVAEGFIVLSGGTRVSVSTRVKPDDLAKGVLVTIQAGCEVLSGSPTILW